MCASEWAAAHNHIYNIDRVKQMDYTCLCASEWAAAHNHIYNIDRVKQMDYTLCVHQSGLQHITTSTT